LSEKLNVGDIVTVILTDKAQDQLFVFNDNNLTLNFSLEEVVVYPFTYTKEMEQIYEFYSNYTKLKDTNRQISLKNKSKRLALR
jgi:fructoselysine-6-P-deglycase FrlB-like protein